MSVNRRVAATSTGVHNASPTASGTIPSTSTTYGFTLTSISTRDTRHSSTPASKVFLNPSTSVSDPDNSVATDMNIPHTPNNHCADVSFNPQSFTR